MRRLVALVALTAAAAAPLRAQTTPSLDRVDSLIAEGRTEAARTTLVAWLAGKETRSRADAQRAIWQRALLTVDPVQAAVDYQRLVVEYPGGPYSDRALLRLAQAAQAQGDPARARQLATGLLRDYPASPARLEAGALVAALGAEPAQLAVTDAAAPAPPEPTEQPVQSVRDPVPPARPVPVVLEPTPPPAEAKAKPAAPPKAAATGAAPKATAPKATVPKATVPKATERKATEPKPAEPEPSEPTRAVATPPPALPPAAVAGRRWTVQLGAFASPERAQTLKAELGSDGVEARVVQVPANRLIRVRTGRFDRQADADRERDRLAARGITATVAGDADREEAAP